MGEETDTISKHFSRWCRLMNYIYGFSSNCDLANQSNDDLEGQLLALNWVQKTLHALDKFPIRLQYLVELLVLYQCLIWCIQST